MDEEVITREAKRLRVSEDDVRNAVGSVMVGRPPPPLFFELGFDIYLYLSDFLDIRTLQSLCQTHSRFAKFCSEGYQGGSIYYRKLDQLIGSEEQRRNFVDGAKKNRPDISPLQLYLSYKAARDFVDSIYTYHHGIFVVPFHNRLYEKSINVEIDVNIPGGRPFIHVTDPRLGYEYTLFDTTGANSITMLTAHFVNFILDGFYPSPYASKIMCRICNQATTTMCSTCNTEICSEDCFKTHIETTH